MRRHALVPALALVVLNGLDVFLTHTVLSHVAGTHEANPIAAFFIATPWAFAIKFAVPLVLLWKAHSGRLQERFDLCALWAITGFYSSVVLSNALFLAR